MSKYCGPGAKVPSHQYPQCWLNIHCIGPVSDNIFNSKRNWASKCVTIHVHLGSSTLSSIFHSLNHRNAFLIGISQTWVAIYHRAFHSSTIKIPKNLIKKDVFWTKLPLHYASPPCSNREPASPVACHLSGTIRFQKHLWALKSENS